MKRQMNWRNQSKSRNCRIKSVRFCKDTMNKLRKFWTWKNWPTIGEVREWFTPTFSKKSKRKSKCMRICTGNKLPLGKYAKLKPKWLSKKKIDSHLEKPVLPKIRKETYKNWWWITTRQDLRFQKVNRKHLGRASSQSSRKHELFMVIALSGKGTQTVMIGQIFVTATTKSRNSLIPRIFWERFQNIHLCCRKLEFSRSALQLSKYLKISLIWRVKITNLWTRSRRLIWELSRLMSKAEGWGTKWLKRRLSRKWLSNLQILPNLSKKRKWKWASKAPKTENKVIKKKKRSIQKLMRSKWPQFY